QNLMVVKSKPVAEPKKAPEPAPEVKPAAKPAAAAPAPAPVAPAPAAKPAPKKAAPPPEPSIADMLMDNINYIGAGLAVLLLALFGLSRRKKKDAVAPTEPSILGAPTDQAHSLFAETGGQSVDTNNSVFNSSFAPSASQLDTNEVDPVAEADVYIAYGRDAQAEEILKEALRTHPERYPVRLKLLEIYAARKDQRAFETQAGEMYGMTKGQGDDWAQAAALGLSIDPLNPLYASAADAAPVAAAPTAEELAQQALLNEQLAGAPDSALMDLDLNLGADTPTALPELEPEPAPGPVKASEDHTLDFDLGGLSFEPISQTTPIAMPGPVDEAAAASNTVPDMEFSTDAPAAPAKTADEESLDMAFDMSFDTPAAAPATAPAATKSLDDISLDLGAEHADLSAEFDMADLAKDLDLPGLSPAAPADPLTDLDAMKFELPAAPADDPFALPDLPGAAPVGHGAPEFDMSSIDLDLPPAAPATSAEDALPQLEEMALATSDPAELSAAHMEMETKLDLAIAYQEIGDKEGARELLDEVIKGGSGEQVNKANEMRSKLA
ncbi:MAG TPA: FimV/HubP family polar landmark protein, partial [Telluria sp.]|nr:FimV/HubP family polar landmark protein [Telluria sp.]